MSDERDKVGRKGLRWVAIGSALLFVVAILTLVAYGQVRSIQMMREFANLWNTTDAIQVYIGQNHKWPRDWDAFSSSFIAVGSRSSYVRDSVVVNFAVGCERTPQPGDWYVHLKSWDIPGEVRTANERLCGHVLGLSRRRGRRE
jgi:hypothetical protein